MELQQFAVHWVSVLSTSGLYSGNYFEDVYIGCVIFHVLDGDEAVS